MMTNFFNRSSLLTSAIVSIAAITGFASVAQAQIKADGSSTVYPLTERAASDFQKATGKRVTVAISGTGGGFKKFCKGETDISNASRPISEKEIKACKDGNVKYVEVMIAMDALTVVVNPANSMRNIGSGDLKKIWDSGSSVNNWKDVGGSDQAMKLFGPGADSGTFDYFTEVINGKAKQSRTDYTASEDDNVVVQGVSRDKGAMGYFGFAYFKKNENRLKPLSVDGVLPTLSNIENSRYKLARPLFLYVNAEKLKNNGDLKSFLEAYLNGAEGIANKVAYLPLRSDLYSIAKGHISEGKTGTRFGGKEPVGMKIEAMVKMEPKD
jgi:phosphate transport system substrate-binding protein